jgi:hypothetical protein
MLIETHQRLIEALNYIRDELDDEKLDYALESGAELTVGDLRRVAQLLHLMGAMDDEGLVRGYLAKSEFYGRWHGPEEWGETDARTLDGKTPITGRQFRVVEADGRLFRIAEANGEQRSDA